MQGEEQHGQDRPAAFGRWSRRGTGSGGGFRLVSWPRGPDRGVWTCQQVGRTLRWGRAPIKGVGWRENWRKGDQVGVQCSGPGGLSGGGGNKKDMGELNRQEPRRWRQGGADSGAGVGLSALAGRSAMP